LIKLSEIPEYRDYGAAIAEGDYERAKRNLIKCIEIATQAEEPEIVALLLQFMGDTEYAAGNKSAAIDSYMKAELTDQESPLIRLHFAKFLLRASNPVAAIQKCDEAEDILRTKWKATGDDLTEAEYRRQINEIRKAVEKPNQGDGE
jgi:tetratricopeptide (TPR) repeat protein